MSDAVALYLPVEPPSLAFLLSCPGVNGVEITEGDESNPRQYKIAFLSMTISINVMANADMPEHLHGFSNYVMSLHIKSGNKVTESVLERIANTKIILGCVIEPEFDKDGYAGGFLASVAESYAGLMFARDCIFDSDGELLIKPA